MLQNSRNVNITGGTLTSAITHVHVTQPAIGEKGIEILQKNISPGAFHNSAERYDAPKCHPHTRKVVLEKIMKWIMDMHKLMLFMWLYGPAGSGKSTIVQTIAEMCSQADLLAASFFFFRSAAGRNDGTRLITTLAYQLALSIPEIRGRIGRAVEYDPLILSRSLEVQMQVLIIQPINEAARDETDGPALKSRPQLVILDGLDECGKGETQHYILRILFAAASQLSIPLYFLIASRPEQLIREAFNDKILNSSTTRIILDNAYQPDADIKVFLEARFEEIRGKHPARASFPQSWPHKKDIQRLVRQSSGQFIYASTVMKFLDSHQHSPIERLKIVFALPTSQDDLPFAELDVIYMHILSSAADIERALDILSVLLLMEFRGTSGRVEPAQLRYVEALLFYNSGDVHIALSDLHSIVDVPPQDGMHWDLPLRTLHASLGDFLFDRSRSGKFFIDSCVARGRIARCLMKHLARHKDLSADDLTFYRSALVPLCINSDPSPELIYEFYTFDDFAAQLAWSAKFPLQIPDLLAWLKKQRHPKFEKDLLRHHLAIIKDWTPTFIEELYSQLYYRYSAQLDRLARSIFTTITLPDFQTFSTEILDVIHGTCIIDSRGTWK
ncbi:hypothetical protein BDZ97DRAFT_261670 [Flammula alnicola]|nr:hypothetical protein BDZ97DRAFT_261670 [Flammula alnicola]